MIKVGIKRGDTTLALFAKDLRADEDYETKNGKLPDHILGDLHLEETPMKDLKASQATAVNTLRAAAAIVGQDVHEGIMLLLKGEKPGVKRKKEAAQWDKAEGKLTEDQFLVRDAHLSVVQEIIDGLTPKLESLMMGDDELDTEVLKHVLEEDRKTMAKAEATEATKEGAKEEDLALLAVEVAISLRLDGDFETFDKAEFVKFMTEKLASSPVHPPQVQITRFLQPTPDRSPP
jgi:hypothetical protein